MVTKMVLSIVAACFGCILMLDGLIGMGSGGFSNHIAIIHLSGGFMLTMIANQVSRRTVLIDKLREEAEQSAFGAYHESSASVVALVTGVWSISHAFFMGPTSNIGIVYYALGFALILIAARHLRKTGWFQKLKDEANKIES